MGFLQSYLRLPRYQRIVLGLTGIALGWYGPKLMGFFFLSDDSSEDKDLKSDVNPSTEKP